MKQTFRKIGTRYNARFAGILFLGLICFPSTAKAQSAGTFTATGNMTTARAGHTATLLQDGMVLIAGGGISAELYDPSTRTFIPTGNMTTSRSGQTATLLANGKVLVAGGAGASGITLASAELYDPLTGTFARTGNMLSARWGHTSTLLNDGRVLMAGGIADASFTSAEIYNPTTGAFTKTGDMIRPRSRHTATSLNDGRVLIAGVYDDRVGAESEDEIYDPSLGKFSRTRRGIGVQENTATLLYDGMVLFVGGSTNTLGEFSGGLLYEPATDTYISTGVMIGSGGNSSTPHGRGNHTATLLRDGRVLIAGGSKLICGTQVGSCHLFSDSSTEIYDPSTRTFSYAGEMTVPRSFQTATLLFDGTVLIAGGATGTPPEFGGPATASAEIYNPLAISSIPLQPGVITTYAGSLSPADGTQAIDYAVNAPISVAPDGAGGFYVAGTCHVYRVTAGGQIRAAAGTGTCNYSGDGGLATSAQFGGYLDLTVDAVGNLYIADTENQRIREVTLDGLIHTVAGNGTVGYSGDGGPATSAQLYAPEGIAVDSNGNLYITETGNNVVRQVTTSGVIRTVAGNGTHGFRGDGEMAISAQLNGPIGVAVDSAGNFYIGDRGNHRIREVTPDGVIQTVAGNGTIPNSSVSGDGGPATLAQLQYPRLGSVDADGNLYIVDVGNNRIRKVTKDGVIRTIAGSFTPGFSGDGGPAVSAQLSSPFDVALDAAGNAYIADYSNNRVRKVTPGGLISTVAGNGTSGYSGDGGPATSAQFDSPLGVAVDGAGNLYIADSGSNRVRKVTPAGVISTVVALSHPHAIAVDGSGNLYIAEEAEEVNRILEVTPDGTIRTIAGNGISGFGGDGGPATSASISTVAGIAVDAEGNLFVADAGNNRIRKVTTGGIISTVYSGIVHMTGIAVDAMGNLYVAAGDYSSGNCNAIIRKLAPNGASYDLFYDHNGNCDPTTGITVDGSGNVYIFNNIGGPVTRITPAGTYAIVAGDFGNGSGIAGDGGLSTLAQFSSLTAITADRDGNLFISDGARIRRVQFGLIVNGITPNSQGRNTVVRVTFSGAGFDSSLVINPVAGITVSNLTIVSPTTATATFTIPATAVPGARSVTVTSSAGTSNAVTFTINPPPGLTSLSPPVGVPGTSVAVTLRGTGFDSGLLVNAGSEITVSDIAVTSSTSAVATFEIASSALLGTHDVTATTMNGTSAPAAFNAVLPFPDLAITSTHTNFGVGFTETFNVVLRNAGLVPTTGAMTITDILPSEFTFASGSGVAWSCSATGQTATCTNTGILGPGASSTLDIAVVVSNGAAPSVVHAISVVTAGDVNPSNDSVSDAIAVAAIPVPRFVISPSPVLAVQQASLRLTLTTPFPHDVSGSVMVSFSSGLAIPVDDPAVQFSSGGRQISFSIPANTFEARFDGNTSAGPVGFQSGTVAGTLGFNGILQVGTIQTTIAPSASLASSLTIPRQRPVIQNIETGTQNGFAVSIDLFSTTRDVTQFSLTFNTTPAVTLSCGTVSGCAVSGPTLTFDVKSMFDAWFNGSAAFGSLSRLRLPLSISGLVHGTVDVRFRNSAGVSLPRTFALP